MRPDPSNPLIEVICSAKVINRRKVTSSNGESELRYVISVNIAAGGETWPIEVSLTNRETMSYRMLIGRSVIPEKASVSLFNVRHRIKTTLSAKPN